jgi:sugar phosphate isomerase/epimerase
MIKLAAMIGTPDLEQETLAVYSGDLAAAFDKVAALGYDGVELMTKDPTQLDGVNIRRWLEKNNLKLAGLCTGHVYGEDGLGLVGPDPRICGQAMARLKWMTPRAPWNEWRRLSATWPITPPRMGCGSFLSR